MPEAETKVEATEETEAAAGDETKPADGDKDTATEEKDSGGEEEAGEETGDEFTAELLDLAASHGYDEAEARAFGTADNLQTAVVGLDSKLAEMGRKAMEASEEEDEVKPAPKPRTMPNRPAKQEEETVQFKVDLGEDVDPEIAKAIQKVVGHLNSKVETLEGKLADTEQYVLDQSNRAWVTKVDALFGTLPEEWEETFGRKPGSEFAESSPQVKNRLKVLDAVEALEKGLQSTGQKLPSDKVLMDRAIQMEFGKQQKAMTRKALSQAAKKRSGQITSRPTSRRGKVGGRDAAIAKSKQFDKDQDAAD